MSNSDPMVAQLVSRRDKNLGQIEALKQAAIDGDRDLTENDVQAIDTYKRSILDIDKQLEVVGDDLRMTDEARNKLATLSPAVKAPTKHRSQGELIYDMLHAGSNQDSAARVQATLKRAAEHMGTIAADTTATAGDVDALYVTPVLGPVIKPDNAFMPMTMAMGTRSMPAGSSFERPFISDANFATGIAAQSAQKAELASKALSADSDLLKRTTLGGYLNISAQLQQWQPDALSQIIDQMNARLSAAIEAFMVSATTTGATATVVAPTADGPTTIKAIYDASAAVYGETNQTATVIGMGPLGWARLGSLVDLGGRPLLPSIGPVNAVGGASASSFSMNGVAGLNTVVTPAIADASFVVLNAACVEYYAYGYPLFEAIEPSVLGRQIAVAADVVAHKPTPFATAVQHLTVA